MAKGSWKPSDEMIASEAFAVFMQKVKPTRTYSKLVLMDALKKPSVYGDFLKLCLEHDDSNDLRKFRHGLLFVVKAIGATTIADQLSISRVTLYRMLWKSGNPRLQSLISLIRVLGFHVWLVDGDFIKSRQKVIRPKDIKSARSAR